MKNTKNVFVLVLVFVAMMIAASSFVTAFNSLAGDLPYDGTVPQMYFIEVYDGAQTDPCDATPDGATTGWITSLKRKTMSPIC